MRRLVQPHSFDWSDADSQLDFERDRVIAQELSDGQEHHAPSLREKLLTAVAQKTEPGEQSEFERWAQEAYHFDYARQASIIASSHYYRRTDYVFCGHSIGRRSFRCEDRWLCSRCSYLRYGKPFAREFGNVHRSNLKAYYLVLSYSSNADENARILFRDITEGDINTLRSPSQPIREEQATFGTDFQTRENQIRCGHLLRLPTEALKAFLHSRTGKLVDGAIAGSEIALRFTPLRVLPHLNVVIWTRDFPEEVARQLRAELRRMMQNNRSISADPGSRLYPRISCYRLPGAEDVRRVLNYSFKPIDVAGAYTLASAGQNGRNSEYMKDLNKQVNHFFAHLPNIVYRLRRVRRFGACHARHRGYLGSPSGSNKRTQRRTTGRARPDQTRGSWTWQERIRNGRGRTALAESRFEQVRNAIS